MNIVNLSTFIAIVETGSLVRASERMNVTQSTVTARLQALETEIGQVLLNRFKSGTTLTPAGAKLLQYAQVMTGLWQQAKTEAGLPAGMDSLFTFGCHPHLWAGLGQQLIAQLTRDRPDMAIATHEGGRDQLESWLIGGGVDVILTFEPFSRGGQSIYALPPDQLRVYSDRENGPIRFDPQYVFVDYGEQFRHAHGKAFHDAGTAKTAFGTPDWALDFILRNGGSAYLPERLAQPHVARGTLFELNAAPVFENPRYLICNQASEQKFPWLAQLIGQLCQ